MFNNIKILLGFKEVWHVSFTVRIHGRSPSCGDGVYTFRPKFTSKMLDDLRAELAVEASIAATMDIDASKINIIGLAKL